MYKIWRSIDELFTHFKHLLSLGAFRIFFIYTYNCLCLLYCNKWKKYYILSTCWICWFDIQYEVKIVGSLWGTLYDNLLSPIFVEPYIYGLLIHELEPRASYFSFVIMWMEVVHVWGHLSSAVDHSYEEVKIFSFHLFMIYNPNFNNIFFQKLLLFYL